MDIDQINHIRLTSDEGHFEIEFATREAWKAVFEKDAAKASLSFETRWGTTRLPLAAIREAAVKGATGSKADGVP